MAGGRDVSVLGPHALWYLTRASGVVLLVLLTLTVVLGILGPLRVRAHWWPSFLTATVHRDVSLLTVALLGVHVATTVLDGYAPISWRDAVVPFLSPYRPLWVGLGALAADLLLALVVTSLLRRRIGLRAWRAVHWSAYASWPIALAHGFGTGSDARTGLLQLVAVSCTAAVLVAAATRLVASAATPRTRLAATAGLVATPALLAGWAMGGPLAPGWSARAGTHVAATAAATRPIVPDDRAPHASPVAARPGPLRPSFAATVQGTVTRATTVAGRPVLDLEGALSGGAAGTLALRFDGIGSVAHLREARRVGVYLGPAGDPTRLWGGLVRGSGDVLTLRLWDRSRTRYDALLRIAVSPDGARWAGSLVVRPHAPAGTATPATGSAATATSFTTTASEIGGDSSGNDT